MKKYGDYIKKLTNKLGRKKLSDLEMACTAGVMLNDLVEKLEEVEKLVKLNAALGIQNQARIEEQQKHINFIMENAVSDSEGIYHCRLKDLYEETNK